MNHFNTRHISDLPGLNDAAQAAQDWLADLMWTPLAVTFTEAAASFDFGDSGSIAFTAATTGTPILNGAGYTITASGYDLADQAVNGPAARAVDVPNTSTPITGAGITIGILSDSFNNNGGEAYAVEDGYLPGTVEINGTIETGGTVANGSSIVNGVDILKDYAGSDEGQAMAEIIHSIAPGATIDFYTAFDSESDFAAGITALVNAGANIIVDDVSYSDEPFFQNAGSITLAVEAAEAKGVDYFTSAGNFASDYYQGTFEGTAGVTLNGINGTQTVDEVSTNGTTSPFVAFNLAAGASTTIDLQWSQPTSSTGGTTYGIEVGFFTEDSDGNFDLLSYQTTENGQTVTVNETYDIQTTNNLPNSASVVGYSPYVEGVVDNTGTSGTVYMAFIQNDGTTTGRNGHAVATSANGSTFKLLFEDNGGLITGPDLGSGSGAVFGHALATGVNAVGAINVSQAPSGAPEYFSSSGTGEILYDSSGNLLSTPVDAAEPVFLGPDGSDTTIYNPFDGTSAAAPADAAVAALVLQADPSLSTTQVTSLLESTATPDNSASTAIAGAGLVNADAAVTAAVNMVTACYCPGTLIETEHGERAIETLAIGDLLRTASGALRPIRWVGRRSYLGRFARHNPHLLPIVFRTGSLAEGVPRRDLWVSPRHAMYLDGVLIQAMDLVNGVTITQCHAAERVDYIHVELDSHDVILAEGAPSESFVDDESRGMFHNAAEYAALYRDAFSKPAQYCAPRVDQGFILQTVQHRLAERAGLRQAANAVSLIGYVDHVAASTVMGWAQNPDQPEVHVCLDVLLDDILVTRTLANQWRADLQAAGLGSGRHAFEAVLPAAIPHAEQNRLMVRRSHDGAMLPLSQEARAARAA